MGKIFCKRYYMEVNRSHVITIPFFQPDFIAINRNFFDAIIFKAKKVLNDYYCNLCISISSSGVIYIFIRLYTVFI